MRLNHFVKIVLIQSYSGPYFPAFGLNRERSECSKIRTRKTPKTDIFYAVNTLQNHVYILFNRGEINKEQK